MDDSIKRFKKRRSDRLKKRMDEEWITMRGTHVLIDDEGQVSKGPSNLKSVVEKSGGYKKKGTVTDLRKPNLGNVNKKPGDPSVEKYIDTLEKGGMKVGGKGSGKGYGVKYNPKSQTGGEYKVKHAEKASAESMRPNIGSHELPEDKWDLKHPNDYPYMHPEKSRLTINPEKKEGKVEPEIPSHSGKYELPESIKESLFPKQELIRGEERSFTSGGKTWDKESLTKLWQDRGYSKKQAEARAEKDLNETLAATKKNREAEEYARTGAEAARERMIERGKSGGKSGEDRERGTEGEKEDWYVREVRRKIEDCVKRMKEKTGYVKMWKELETDLDLAPDGTSVKVGDIVYTKGTDKYGDNGWLFTNEFGRKEGLVYNWTDGRFADEIARAIRGGKSSSIVVKQKGK